MSIVGGEWWVERWELGAGFVSLCYFAGPGSRAFLLLIFYQLRMYPQGYGTVVGGQVEGYSWADGTDLP